MFFFTVPSRESDAAACERLAAPLANDLYRTCLRMMQDRQDAEDCVQETLLRAFRAFARFSGRSSFSTWIYRICVNTCLDALRTRRPQASLDLLREKGVDFPDTAASAYAALETAERRRLIREGLAQLPPEMRAVLVLRDMENKSVEETAQILRLPQGTVKSRLNRAREKLVRFLRKQPELIEPSSVQMTERRKND